MKHTPLLLIAPAVTPELARRFGAIIAGLVAVVARRFLREPRLAGLILPLCRWFARAAQRFARVSSAPAIIRASRAGRSGGAAARGIRLPSQRAWLLRELQYEAAAYRLHLEALLAEPEMRAALDAAPRLGRLLRPLCHMLGIDPPAVPAAPEAPPAPGVIAPEVTGIVRPWQAQVGLFPGLAPAPAIHPVFKTSV